MYEYLRDMTDGNDMTNLQELAFIDLPKSCFLCT